MMLVSVALSPLSVEVRVVPGPIETFPVVPLAVNTERLRIERVVHAALRASPPDRHGSSEGVGPQGRRRRSGSRRCSGRSLRRRGAASAGRVEQAADDGNHDEPNDHESFSWRKTASRARPITRSVLGLLPRREKGTGQVHEYYRDSDGGHPARPAQRILIAVARTARSSKSARAGLSALGQSTRPADRPPAHGAPGPPRR